MRYKLNAEGYICAVSFGCYLDGCREYTGAIPVGYNSLDEWASYSCIQAYYIDMDGNLVLDYAKKIECENKQAQELIDYSPVLRKDLYETDELLNGQYLRNTVTGKVIVLEDIKTIAPRVKITDIKPCEYNELRIYTQGKNMMRCDAVSTNISGVTFTKNISGSITILGTATEDIEYIVSDGEATPIFALKENHDYFLNLGGMQCELRCFDGETTAQQYVGASGLLNLPKSIEVTQVVIKIAEGETVNTTFYPQVERGKTFTGYDSFKCKPLLIDISEIWNEPLLPSNTLYADDTLYPGVVQNVIDYIIIEEGKITISVNGEARIFGNGSVGLFSSYSTIYATKDVTLEVEYSTNLIAVDTLEFLQGKATTTNQFKILKDGSIEAHNGYFSGKIEADSGYFKGKIEADSGYFKGKIESKEGEIGGFTITDYSLYYGKNNSIGMINGIYIGTNGLSVGNNFIVHPDSDGVEIGTFINFTSTNGIKHKGTTILSFNSVTHEIEVAQDMKIDKDLELVSGDLIMTGATSYIRGLSATNYKIKFESTKTTIMDQCCVLGKYGGSIGFFGGTGYVKQTLAAITTPSSATVSEVATKINSLISILKNYNLIG